MGVLRISIVLFKILAICSCGNSKSSDYNDGRIEVLSKIENQLTTEGFFWQSKPENDSISVEILFKKDGTAIALWSNNKYSETGKWSFDFDDKSSNLQIAWRNSEQLSAEVMYAKMDWSEIALTNNVHKFGGKTLMKMKLLDNRFGE